MLVIWRRCEELSRRRKHSVPGIGCCVSSSPDTYGLPGASLSRFIEAVYRDEEASQYGESLTREKVGRRLEGFLRPLWRSARSGHPSPRGCPVSLAKTGHSYTYTVYMKNITLSVDENILATVRRQAAERNSTVNALVRDYLTNLAAHEDRANRARVRLRQLSKESQGRLGRKTWSREQLHDR